MTCERNGWNVRKVFSDNSISASRFSVKDRPEWKKTKSELRAGDVLVVWEASRAQRDLLEFVELRDLCAGLGVQLSYSGKFLDMTLGDDRFVGGLDALIAERESEQIRVRVLRGKNAAAAEGRPPGRAPWGYYSPRPGVWEPDPVEAPRVREAADRVLSGESSLSVLRWLKETGRAPVDATMLRRSLANPALAAQRVHRGAVVGPGKWEPIISREQLHALREQYRLNPPSPGPEARHFLSGIARCGKCEGTLRHKHHKHRRDCYICPAGHVSRIAEELDAVVVGHLMRRLERVDPAQYEDDGSAAEVAKQVDDIQADLDGWVEKAIAGEVSPESFSKIERGLKDRIRVLWESVPAPIGSVDADTLRANWATLSVAERRNVVRLFLRVTIPQVGARTRALPGDVLVEEL